MKTLSAGIKVERKIVYNDLKSHEVTIIILRLLNLGLKKNTISIFGTLKDSAGKLRFLIRVFHYFEFSFVCFT